MKEKTNKVIRNIKLLDAETEKSGHIRIPLLNKIARTHLKNNTVIIKPSLKLSKMASIEEILDE